MEVSTPGSPDSKDATQHWTVPFGSAPCGQIGQPPCFFGGNAVLTWTYSGAAEPGGSVQSTFNLQICGKNPSSSIADSTIRNTVPYWFAPNISVHETRESQFCETGRMRIAYCASSKNVGKPVLGVPAGYGMMQLDPVPSVDALWNWQTNVGKGKAKIDHCCPK